MRDLNHDVGRSGDELAEKSACLVATVRQLQTERSTHMDDEGHSVAIGRAEHAPQLLDVLRVVVVHTGIAEVHLHAVPEVRVLRAARELGERVILQRIDAAEPDEAIGVSRHLLAGPVIVRPQPLGGIVDLSRPLLPDVGRRKHHRALDAGGIEQGNHLVAANWRDGCRRRSGRDQRGQRGTEQVLVMVGQRRVLRVRHRSGEDDRNNDGDSMWDRHAD